MLLVLFILLLLTFSGTESIKVCIISVLPRKVLQKWNDARGSQCKETQFGLFWLVNYSCVPSASPFRHLHTRIRFHFLQCPWAVEFSSRAGKGAWSQCARVLQGPSRDTQQKQFSFLHPGFCHCVLASPPKEFFPSLIIQCNIHFLSPHEPHIPMCSNKWCRNQLGRSCKRPKHLRCPVLTTSTEKCECHW